MLVQILKQEWPHNWPTFISDIVAASKVSPLCAQLARLRNPVLSQHTMRYCSIQTSESICENNMEILRLLSEEVFDFGKEELTSEKARTMREGLNQEFAQIFHLCDFVLQHAARPSLLIATLQCLQRFLTWIPAGYVFETPLLQLLIQKFLPEQAFRNYTVDVRVFPAQVTLGKKLRCDGFVVLPRCAAVLG